MGTARPARQHSVRRREQVTSSPFGAFGAFCWLRGAADQLPTTQDTDERNGYAYRYGAPDGLWNVEKMIDRAIGVAGRAIGVAGRAIGVAGIGIGIISGLILIVFPKYHREVGIAGLVLGVLLLGVAGGIALMPDGNAQSPPVVNQGPGSAYSYGQQGGSTIGTLNVGAVPRRVPTTQASALTTAIRQRNITGIIEVQTDVMGCIDCDGFLRSWRKY
jgi:hypothetical protein